MTGHEQTAQACAEAVKAADDGVAWLNVPANAERVGGRKAGLEQRLRKNARKARKLQKAVSRPTSFSVYGASQSGKSFLISALAAPPGGGDLMVLPHAGAGGLPFLDLNPGGNRESTGLVTRFTRRPISAPAGFPVLLELLSGLDIVKMLINSFFNDLDMGEEQPVAEAALEQALRTAEDKQGGGRSALTSDDFYDLQDYFARYQNLSPVVRSLSEIDYWSRAAAIAAQLDKAALTALLEPLWGRVEPLTGIFRKLYTALEQLGFATEVHCPIGALSPREDANNRPISIIDVDTLNRMRGAESEPLQVRHGGGVATLERPVVAALTAELVLNITSETRPFLANVDLLDFPGARSRKRVENPRVTLAEPTQELEKVFLRGKVAHLFDRYREEHDLSSMILCVADGPQEVAELPKLISDWVKDTHGATPQARRNADTALFLVLTKFDRQFGEQKGEGDNLEARWISRINATIADYLATSGNWLPEWRPGAPFHNTFWLRNPNIVTEGLFDMQGDREIRVSAGKADRIAKLKGAYLSTEHAARYFKSPEQSFEATFMLNDGGVSYLAEALDPISRRDLKIAQIALNIQEISRDCLDELKQYYIDEDEARQRAARIAAARRLAEELEYSRNTSRFGLLLSFFHLSPQELEGSFRAVKLRETASRIAGAPRRAAASRAPGAGGQRGPLDCQHLDPDFYDLADQFACRAWSKWQEKVEIACRDPQCLDYFDLTHDGALTLASELIAGGRRLDVAGIVSNEVRPVVNVAGQGGDMGAETPSLIAASIVNEFVNRLGHSPRFVNGQGNGAAGPDRNAMIDRAFPELGEEPVRPDLGFADGWLQGLVSFIEANAAVSEGRTYDAEQNGALGEILAILSSTAASGPGAAQWGRA